MISISGRGKDLQFGRFERTCKYTHVITRYGCANGEWRLLVIVEPHWSRAYNCVACDSSHAKVINQGVSRVYIG